MRRMTSWPKKIKAGGFPADFCNQNFLGWVESLCRHSIDCCFVSRSYCYNQVLSMVNNHKRKSYRLQCAKNISKVSPTTDTVEIFYPRSGISRPTTWRASACPDLHEWWTEPRSCEMPSCLAIDTAEIRRSSKINLSVWSLSLRLGHCFGSSRMKHLTGGNITMFKLGHRVLTVAYNGACSPNVSVRMVCISFGALPCRKKNW
jgi:hypothetical protein